MFNHLPNPVLSIAVQAVSEVQSEDALGGLWNIFTKCKEGLEEGRRLENISWRLWYRHMSSTSPHTHNPAYAREISRTPSPILDSSSESEEENWEDETTVGDDDDATQASSSVLPVSVVAPTSSLIAASSHLSRPRAPISRSASPVRAPPCPVRQRPASASQGLSGAYRPTETLSRYHTSPSARSPINVGKFISDMLPEKAVPDRRRAQPVASTSRTSGPSLTVPETAPHAVQQPVAVPDIVEPLVLQTPAKRFPTVVLTQPTPRPTPLTTPILQLQATMPGPVPAFLESTIAGPSHPAKKFPLQEVNEEYLATLIDQPKEVLIKDTQKREKIFFIASPGDHNNSSCSDSFSLSSLPNRDAHPTAPTPSPETAALASSPSPERPSGPPRRTSSKKSVLPIPTKHTKHIGAKHRMLGTHTRQGTNASALSGGRFGAEKAKAAAVINARKVDGDHAESITRTDKGKGRELPAPAVLARQVSEPGPSRAPAKPPVPAGVGSPMVTRRRQPQPAQEPAPAPTLPSSSPAVLRAPPPTPVSRDKTAPAVTRHAPSMQSPEAPLRAPPPTPVTTSAPRMVNIRPRTHSPPPPVPMASSPEDDSDSDDWEYESGSESEDAEEVVARARREVATAEARRARDLQQAAEEAQRQREMFVKRRTRSRVELEELGRQPAGLSQLFHPDPETLAKAELYRTQSMLIEPAQAGMIDRTRAHHSAVELGGRPAAAPSAPAPIPAPSRPPVPAPAQRRSGPTPFLRPSKSSVAVPTLQSESVTSSGQSVLDSARRASTIALPSSQSETGLRPSKRGMGALSTLQKDNSIGSGRSPTGSGKSAMSSARRFRLGPPQGEVESEEEPEDPDVGMSKSVAQRRLEELASRSGSRNRSPAKRSSSSNEAPPHATTSKFIIGSDGTSPSSEGPEQSPPAPSTSQPINILPVHPYNLPRAEQNTPRTHMRKMMEAELSESMRRQLLWVRVSKKRLLGPDVNNDERLTRTRSEEEFMRTDPLAQRLQHGQRVADLPGGQPPPSLPPPASPDVGRRHTGGLRPLTPLQPLTPERAAALQRTRSLAEGLAHNDYHIAGW